MVQQQVPWVARRPRPGDASRATLPQMQRTRSARASFGSPPARHDGWALEGAGSRPGSSPPSATDRGSDRRRWLPMTPRRFRGPGSGGGSGCIVHRIGSSASQVRRRRPGVRLSTSRPATLCRSLKPATPATGTAIGSIRPQINNQRGLGAWPLWCRVELRRRRHALRPTPAALLAMLLQGPYHRLLDLEIRFQWSRIWVDARAPDWRDSQKGPRDTRSCVGALPRPSSCGPSARPPLPQPSLWQPRAFGAGDTASKHSSWGELAGSECAENQLSSRASVFRRQPLHTSGRQRSELPNMPGRTPATEAVCEPCRSEEGGTPPCLI